MPSYEIRQLAREITSFYLKNEKIDLEKFTAYVQSNANLNKTFNHINSFGNDKIPDSSELLDYIRAIEEYNLKQQALKLKAKLVSCQNEEDSIRLLTQLKEVSLQLEANLSL